MSEKAPDNDACFSFAGEHWRHRGWCSPARVDDGMEEMLQMGMGCKPRRAMPFMY